MTIRRVAWAATIWLVSCGGTTSLPTGGSDAAIAVGAQGGTGKGGATGGGAGYAGASAGLGGAGDHVCPRPGYMHGGPLFGLAFDATHACLDPNAVSLPVCVFYDYGGLDRSMWCAVAPDGTVYAATTADGVSLDVPDGWHVELVAIGNPAGGSSACALLAAAWPIGGEHWYDMPTKCDAAQTKCTPNAGHATVVPCVSSCADTRPSVDRPADCPSGQWTCDAGTIPATSCPADSWSSPCGPTVNGWDCESQAFCAADREWACDTSCPATVDASTTLEGDSCIHEGAHCGSCETSGTAFTCTADRWTRDACGG